MNSLTNLALRPVAGKPGMSESSIRRLANCEYSFVQIDASIADLAEDLHRSAHDAPSCIPATLALKKLRRDLRMILKSIDADVSDAIVASEALPGAPF